MSIFKRVEKVKKVKYPISIESNVIKDIESIERLLSEVNVILTERGEEQMQFDLDERLAENLRRTVKRAKKEITSLHKETCNDKASANPAGRESTSNPITEEGQPVNQGTSQPQTA